MLLADPAASGGGPARTWIRAWHSWAAIAVALLQVATILGGLQGSLLEGPGLFAWEMLWFAGLLGLMFGDLMVLGVWCALGGLPTLARWGLATLLTTAVCGGFAWRLGEEDSLLTGVTMTVFAMSVVLALAMLLLPLRTVFHLRLDFSVDYHPRAERPRGQWRFSDFLVWSLGLAIPLALFRLAASGMQDQASSLEETLAALACFALPPLLAAGGCCAALFARGRRNQVLAWLGLPLGLCLLAGGMTLGEAYDLDPFGGVGEVAGISVGALLFVSASAGAVLSSLGVLRLFGLQWLTLPQRASQPSASARPTA